MKLENNMTVQAKARNRARIARDTLWRRRLAGVRSRLALVKMQLAAVEQAREAERADYWAAEDSFLGALKKLGGAR